MVHLAAWTSSRLAGGSEPIARIIGRAALRAFTWFAAWRVAGLLGTALTVVLVVAVCGLAVWFRRAGRRKVGS